jgi:EAL domain-containing protein (putative c-di-GMP-specific phosphodiesterase class I)
VSVSTERIVGTEALVRWEHPDRGLLEPAEFIGVAEECGLIIPLGAWVLEQACRQAQRWNTPPGGTLEVAVNLSSRQLLQPDLVEQVQAMVSESGVDPGLMHMCLEITESAMMDDAVVTMRTLERLKELGVRIAVDDFGTGYSSLAYLSRFPVDVLKIDRSFVAGLGQRDQSRAIVASIVELGHALDLEVVAEGVETDEQLWLLREVGCDLAQGFLLARPQPADRVTELLGGEITGLRA